MQDSLVLHVMICARLIILPRAKLPKPAQHQTKTRTRDRKRKALSPAMQESRRTKEGVEKEGGGKRYENGEPMKDTLEYVGKAVWMLFYCSSF